MVLLCFMALLAGCSTRYDDYFTDFDTTEPFTAAELTLELPAGVTVESYFGEGYYVIRRYISGTGENTIYSYGIATADYVIIEPLGGDGNLRTFFSGIVDIKDGIAIVTVKQQVTSGTTFSDKLGAVLLIGDHSYSDALVPYQYYIAGDASIQPVRFAGDYIAVLGSVNVPATAFNSASEFTFYKLNDTTKKLDRQFAMKGNGLSTFEIFDSYMYAKHAISGSSENSRSYYQISYYDIDDTDESGCVKEAEIFEPYTEEARNNLQTIAPMGSYDIYTYYLGNGIFMRAGLFKCAQDFTGSTMIVPDEKATYYAMMYSDRFSMLTKGNYRNDRLFPVLAVNKYNDKEMHTIATSYNSAFYTRYDETTEKRPIYDYPVYPVSALPKGDYSLVYYYYFPFAGDPAYDEDSQRTAQISFRIMDNTLSGSKNFDNLMMPAVFIDGVGFETDSPYFNALMGGGSAVLYKSNGKTLTLEKTVWNNSVKKTYQTKVYGNRMAVVEEYDAAADKIKYGAYTVNSIKTSAKLTVPFIYDELTPFFGDYATGSTTAADGTRTFYRVKYDGTQERIYNVYALKNGAYVSRVLHDGKYIYGLYSNSGTAIIDYAAEEMTLIEEFLTDGEFVKTTVVARVGDKDVIYKLGH